MRNRKFSFIRILLLVLTAFSFGCGRDRDPVNQKVPAALPDAESTVITKDGTALLSIVRGKESWEAVSGVISVKITGGPEGYQFALGREMYSVKQKDGKIRLNNHDGNTVFTVKTGGDKVKVSAGKDGADVCTFKLKEAKMKYSVKKGEKELGMVKYYPDKKSVRAVDEKGKEQCRAESDRLVLSPGVCLITSLSDKEKLLLFVVMNIAVK